jgi:hypothetical protein
VFHNTSNGYCRIHEQFGMDAKPLGCQLYPYQIVPTFNGEATVTGRFDCPTVRKNHGASYADEMPQLRKFEKKLTLPDSFDEQQCDALDRDQIESLCEFTSTLMHGFDRGEGRALFIASLCSWLAKMNNTDLDRAALAGAFADLKTQVDVAVVTPVKRPGLIHRLTFRTLLGLYLRRDEDVLDGRAGRFSRLMSMIALVFGFGSFRGLGVIHPSGKVRKARLFRDGPKIVDQTALELHWRMITVKLTSFQFFGSAYYGRDMLSGLRSLAMLYPYVLATAKYRAGNRGSPTVDAEDVDYAVSVIEHSFGRSPVLAQGFAHVLEAVLMDREMFTRLVLTV